ncbi:MAG TPA: hypothetical protein PLX54_00265 [Candidatus Fermentibacter daniensis]|jgi:hypothetical protein|nr:MAG: hypothetical protein AO395_04915 [Candidatus Fermentibacter daniensis]OQC68978.1 MAG: hypothetical protein BWX47_01503 [candidate division Hyd24-12 bacterium ADurb.Bin004]KZD18524.1 MAG: hypothetical protein AO396_02130 [Candidatus Fermentibacter daniensis]KZD20058.1 MAG: hypothetical protein AO394_09275 [Candidatus Fermentibacter daniensis]HOD18617.1 hypothetical protein [Candidatus Fermentibacter daniensis]
MRLRMLYPVKSLVPAVLLFLASDAASFGFIDSYRGGSPESGAGAYSAALAGRNSTHTGDAFAIFLNPAGLSSLDETHLAVAAGALGWKETHARELGREYRTGSITGMRCFSASTPLGSRFVIGAGISAVADADYNGTRLLYDELSGITTGQEILEASGTQWDAVAGASYEPAEGFSIGVSGGYRTGVITLDYYRYDNDLAGVDSVYYGENDIGEPAVRVGAMQRTELSTLGVSYSAGGECLAPVLSCGFSILAPHLQNTRVGFEADLMSPLGRNDYGGRLSIEYPLLMRTMVMLGVSFSNYSSESGSGMGFSVGGNQGLGKLDLTVAMHWQTKRVFGRYIPGEDSDWVDDSTTELMMGLSIRP